MLCGNLEFIHLTAGTTSIGANIASAPTYLCSESENCYAKEYADAYGLTFKVCSGHGAGRFRIFSYGSAFLEDAFTAADSTFTVGESTVVNDASGITITNTTTGN